MKRGIVYSAVHLILVISTTSAGLAGNGASQAQQPEAIYSDYPDERGSTLDERSQRALAVQVALDRAGFSPGELDAATGNNTRGALRAFQESHGLAATGEPDERTMTSLGAAFNDPVAPYTIGAEDVAGPFVETVPTDMMEKAKLPALVYSSVLELLSERFHAESETPHATEPKCHVRAR